MKFYTLNDLYKFCLNNDFTKFSSKEFGGPLVVHEVGSFEVDDSSTKGLLPVRLKACHIDLNRNNSFISEEVMKAALDSFKNRPILANIIKLNDGTYDFRSHDYEIVDDPFNEGEQRVEFIERPIGIIPESCEAKLEYDEEMDKTYVVVNGYIFEDYGNKAADILREKKATKVSVELCIEEMSFNAKEKYLSIDKFYFNGVTALGKKEDGTEIGEGMLGSNMTISDFSSKENSMFSSNEDINKTMVEMLATINQIFAKLNKQQDHEEGGVKLDTLVELLKKYNKTVEDLNFDYENMSDEELTEKFEELFEEKVITNNNENTNTVQIGFEISHEDIRCALYALIDQYNELDDDWYYISTVYDDYFIMQSYTGAVYGQKYSIENDTVALDGERYSLHCEYLTDSELAELNNMRKNYSELEQFKANVLLNQEREEKMNLLNSDEYSSISDVSEFNELLNDVDNYTLDELSTKADLIFAKEMKKQNNFLHEKSSKKPFISYGLHNENKPSKNSYFEGLLNLNK